MGDAEGVHYLFAGLLLMIEDARHDRRDTLLERRIGGAHQFLVVLDEVHPGRDQFADEFRRLVRPQAECRLDNRADDRASHDASEAFGAGNSELRSRISAPEFVRQLHIDDADTGHALDRIDAADRDGHERSEIGTYGVEGKGDIDIGAVQAACPAPLPAKSAGLHRRADEWQRRVPRRATSVPPSLPEPARRCLSTGRWRSYRPSPRHFLASRCGMLL